MNPPFPGPSRQACLAPYPQSLRGDKSSELIDRSVLRVFDCSPGGNDTYIALAPGLPRSLYGSFHKDVLGACPWFEQGGFIEPVTDLNVVARLQMAGGEFCGNAARALGALLAKDFLGSRILATSVRYGAMQGELSELRFKVEISGSAAPLAVVVRPGMDYEVSITLPLRSELVAPSQAAIAIEGRVLRAEVVSLDGITHIVVDSSQLRFDSTPAVFRARMQSVIAQLGLTTIPAVGMIWCSAVGDQQRIDPVVWVKATEDCIYESACGSGSIALALTRWAKGGTEVLDVLQPSGASTKVRIAVSAIEGASATLSGPVMVRGMLPVGSEAKIFNKEL